MRDAIERGGFLNDPIGLLKAIGKTVQTNIPRKKLPDLADAAAKVDRTHIYRAVITHPLVKSGFDRRGSIQLPVIKSIRRLADDLFPADGSLPKRLVPGAQELDQARLDEWRERLRPGADEEADAEADEEADREADGDGNTEATPTPTPVEPTPTPVGP